MVEKYYKELCAANLFSAVSFPYTIVVKRFYPLSTCENYKKNLFAENCALVWHRVMGILIALPSEADKLSGILS